MKIPTVKTDRLLLRALRPGDAGALHMIYEPEEVRRYFPRPGPMPMDKVMDEITRDLEHWEKHGYGWWAVETLAKEALAGWAGLKYLPETSETEVAGLLAREYWGQGMAVEAAREGLRFGFEDHGLKVIIGLAHPDNTRSRRVLEKLGMSYTGEAEYFNFTVCRYVLESPSLSK
jgi:ribosomal-protein-alanine N-acetyltransferase